MRPARAALVWIGLLALVFVPLGVAASSPLLAWRAPAYIVAGLSGVLGLGLMLVQPALAGGYVPGLEPSAARRLHRFAGISLAICVALHLALLWVTSPPDVVDALTFTAPTLFSHLGVVALWAVFAAAGFALLRHSLRPRTWRLGHRTSVAVAVIATVGHAVLIEGTMGTISKAVLCLAVLAATCAVLVKGRPWRA